MKKQLTRSKNDQILGGVCSGLGRYFGIDTVLVRLAFVLFTLAGGAGLLVYLILLVVMPLDTASGPDDTIIRDPRRNSMIAGGALILIGTWYLLQRIPALSWLRFSNLWPLVLIAVGVIMILNYTRGRSI